MEDYRAMWQELGLNVSLHEEMLDHEERIFKNTVGSQKLRPDGMRVFDLMLHNAHRERVRELLDGKAAGSPIVGTFCIYVPDEIIMAAGCTPVPLCGGTQWSIPYAEAKIPRDICPLVKSTLGLAFSKTCPYAPIKSLAVGETTCDAKKKTWDILSQMVHFHVIELPQKKNPTDVALWKQELELFRARVEQVSCIQVTLDRLKNSIRIMNDKRKALQKLDALRRSDLPPISGLDSLVVMQAALNADPVHFTKMLNELNDELVQRITDGVSPFKPKAHRIMVSGTPSVMGNWKVHYLLEQSGAVVVADETCTGAKYYEQLVEDESNNLDGLLEAVADRYFSIDCSCFTPNNARLAKVSRMAKDSNADGVIQYILQYCHTYNLEAGLVEKTLKQAGLPSMKIVTDYSEEDTGQLRTRIEAFLERLD